MDQTTAETQLAKSEMIRRALMEACVEMAVEFGRRGREERASVRTILDNVIEAAKLIKPDSRGLQLSSVELDIVRKEGIATAIEAIDEVIQRARKKIG